MLTSLLCCNSSPHQVNALSATLSETEVSYLNLTQQQLTIETELRTSLEELHLKDQHMHLEDVHGTSKISVHPSLSNTNTGVSLLTEEECDRLIRESQSAMVC
jgi:hypothetical protein